MANKLELVNGLPRMTAESVALPTIYDESLLVVSGAPGAGEITGPISTGTPITLPSAETYEGIELEVHIGGQVLEDVGDFNFVGAGPTRTQISFTFDIVVGDQIRFRKTRDL